MWDSGEGQCLQRAGAPECESGFELRGGRCHRVALTANPICPAGSVWDSGETQCLQRAGAPECESGFELRGGRCHRVALTANPICPAGSVWDSGETQCYETAQAAASATCDAGATVRGRTCVEQRAAVLGCPDAPGWSQLNGGQCTHTVEESYQEQVGQRRVAPFTERVRVAPYTRRVRVAPFTERVRVAPYTRRVRVAPFAERVRVAPYTRRVRVAPFAERVRVAPYTRRVRVAPFTERVRVAPYTRRVRVAPFAERVRVAPYTRRVRVAPFAERVRVAPYTRRVRVAPFAERVRVAPYTRRVRVAPFAERVRVAPYTRRVRVAPFTERVRVAPYTETYTAHVTYTYTVRVRDRCIRWDHQNGGCLTWSYRTETRTGCCRTETRTRAAYNYETRQVYNYVTRPAYNYETRQVYNYVTRPAYNYETRAVYNYVTRPAYNYETRAVYNYVTRPAYNYETRQVYNYVTRPAYNYETRQVYNYEPVYETRTRPVSTLHPASLMCGTGFERSGSTCTRQTPAQPRCASDAWTLSGWTCTGPRAVAPTGCPAGFTLRAMGPPGPGYSCTPQVLTTDANCPTSGSRLHQSAGVWSCVTTVAPTGCPAGFTLRAVGPPGPGYSCTPQVLTTDANCPTSGSRLHQSAGVWSCVTTVAPTGCPTGYTLDGPSSTGRYSCTTTQTSETDTTAITQPPEQACSTDLGTLGSEAVTRTGSWSASCPSTQRGNARTPYYAHSYTFSLAAAADVDISLVVHGGGSGHLALLPPPGTSVPRDPATGTNPQISAEALPEGTHTIKTSHLRDRTQGTFTLTVLAAATACGDEEVRVYGGACSPADQRVYEFTEGTIVSTRTVASGALLEQDFLRDHRACTSRAVDPLTIDKLSALMLAVPVHELQRSSPSPMFLGRSDNLRQNTRNEWLYSRNTREDERRAHWHAGVGLWQLDPWPPVRALNHAERADIAVGGAVVAAYIRDEFCEHSGQPLWEREVFGPWLACKADSNPVHASRDLCPPTYLDIYDEAGDSMWVIATEGSQSDGGVQDRLCIWSDRMPLNYERGFGCYLYDPERHEGNMDIRSMEGTDSAAKPNGLTPLAVAFISLANPDGSTHAGTKYAVFPAAETGYAHTLIKAVAQATEARASRLGPDGNGWYVGDVDGRALYVREGTNEQCGASEAATPPVCGWTRM